MTAPRNRPIREDLFPAFVAYHRLHPSWGVFHTCLEDGNWKRPPCEDCVPDEVHGRDLLLIMVAEVQRLSESQRRRLASRVEAITLAQWRRRTGVAT